MEAHWAASECHAQAAPSHNHDNGDFANNGLGIGVWVGELSYAF